MRLRLKTNNLGNDFIWSNVGLTYLLQNTMKYGHTPDYMKKDQHKEYSHQYKQDHKEELKQYNQQYNQDNKEKRNQYRQDHKEETKQYYQDHKEELNQKRYKKITCFCGGKYTHANRSRHLKSKKHQSWLQSQSQ